MRLATAFGIGLLFGLGILLSGMANPAKVLNFFDLFGTWDPSLAFVMGGALAVAAPGYAILFRRRARPALAPRFDLPDTRRIDAPLVLGSLGFGVGWGIAGFCPGGALPALGTGRWEVVLFVASAAAGLLIARALRAARTRRAAA
jgi:uncharacterized membrane protein YedE/YeeE